MARIEKITAPRGMPDTLPAEMPPVRRIEDVARRVFRIYGYEEIRTPMFEDTRLFVRGIGEATDIVEKEMYTFLEPTDQKSEPSDEKPESRGEASITLRPEGTAPVVRAVVEHELLKQRGFWKLYYIGPMFRKERPQAGRLRQFSQIGCEAIGSYEPSVDAESLLLASRFFREIGLDRVQVKINSIGCPNCRTTYRDVLRRLLGPRRAELCKDCQSRFDRNVFRVLDCKNPTCREIALQMPPMREHLDADCRWHFEAVTMLLRRAGLAFAVDDHLVRGFDYYTRTVFELSHGALGARDAVCGGGRYDNLVAELGGPSAGCVGFAVGVVPTILALHKTRAERLPESARADAFLIAVSAASGTPLAAPHPASAPKSAKLPTTADEIRPEIFRMAEKLRATGLRVELDYERRSLKAQMRSANRIRARYAIVVGPDELAAGKVKLKDMQSGAEETLTLDEVATRILRRPMNEPSGMSRAT